MEASALDDKAFDYFASGEWRSFLPRAEWRVPVSKPLERRPRLSTSRTYRILVAVICQFVCNRGPGHPILRDDAGKRFLCLCMIHEPRNVYLFLREIRPRVYNLRRTCERGSAVENTISPQFSYIVCARVCFTMSVVLRCCKFYLTSHIT